MLINIINKNITKILLFLIVSPGSRYNRKEIKEAVNLNNTPLDNSLVILLNLKMIKRVKNLYSLNLDNELIKQIMKEREPLSNLPLKIQYMIIDFLESAIKNKSIKNIVLFGSYSKIIFTDNSDIDLAIIIEKENSNTASELLKIARKISKKYKKAIQIHFFSESDIKHREDPLIKDILKNGRELL